MKLRSFNRRRDHFILLTSVCLTLLAGGCSTFNRDWKRAGTTPVSTNTIEGRWEGFWLSSKNGHTGKLRCLTSKIDDQQIRARFRATYWKIFRFGYEATLKAEPLTNNTIHIQGENDLGWWGGGVYHYDGTVSPTNFASTYRSKYDHGTFEMKRPLSE